MSATSSVTAGSAPSTPSYCPSKTFAGVAALVWQVLGGNGRSDALVDTAVFEDLARCLINTLLPDVDLRIRNTLAQNEASDVNAPEFACPASGKTPFPSNTASSSTQKNKITYFDVYAWLLRVRQLLTTNDNYLLLLVERALGARSRYGYAEDVKNGVYDGVRESSLNDGAGKTRDGDADSDAENDIAVTVENTLSCLGDCFQADDVSHLFAAENILGVVSRDGATVDTDLTEATCHALTANPPGGIYLIRDANDARANDLLEGYAASPAEDTAGADTLNQHLTEAERTFTLSRAKLETKQVASAPEHISGPAAQNTHPVLAALSRDALSQLELQPNTLLVATGLNLFSIRRLRKTIGSLFNVSVDTNLIEPQRQEQVATFEKLMDST